jgi:hypothetical protein
MEPPGFELGLHVDLFSVPTAAVYRQLITIALSWCVRLLALVLDAATLLVDFFGEL